MMCDWCKGTGMIHVLRFYKTKRTPYEVCEPCVCAAGSAYLNGRYRFQTDMIGLHYTLVRNDPLVFIDDRVYEYDIDKQQTHRAKDIKPLTKQEINDRLHSTGLNGGQVLGYVINV